MLVKTSLNDSQGDVLGAGEVCGEVKDFETNDAARLLFIIWTGAGGASGRYDYLKEIAFDYAFLLRSWGWRQV